MEQRNFFKKGHLLGEPLVIIREGIKKVIPNN